MENTSGQFNAEKAFQVVLQELKKISELQGSQQKISSDHTGTLAEILVTVKRLDEERLVAHNRVTQVVHDVELLKRSAAI